MNTNLNKISISVIVPFYNVEKYISKCLNSIQSQTFRNFEVILIDDGSTDNSLKIAKRYSDNNISNTILVSRNNKGIAQTRNEALELCNGDYIAFVDSDDFLEPSYLQSLYDKAIKTDADITCCNYSLYYPKNNKKIFMPFRAFNGVYSKEKALKKLLLDITFHSFLWGKLIKRSLFNKVKFCNRYFEDLSTLPKLFYYANKISVIDKALYFYTSRRDSILGKASAQKINDLILSAGIIKDFLISKNDIKKYNIHMWLFCQRIKLVSAFFIFQMHLVENNNINGLLKNLQSSFKSLDFYNNKSFQNLHNYNKIPFEVISPINKKSKKDI